MDHGVMACGVQCVGSAPHAEGEGMDTMRATGVAAGQGSGMLWSARLIALAGFIAGVGIALVVFAMWGIQRGQRWAFWGAVISAVVAVGVALPLHYPYGLATIGHLGLIYLDLLIFAVGF